MRRVLPLTIVVLLVIGTAPSAQRTVKPPLHGRHWVAITGKPLGATAGAMIFQKGGNAVDAACGMLGAVATMWDRSAGAARRRPSSTTRRRRRSSASTRSASRRLAPRRSSSGRKACSTRLSSARSRRSRRARLAGYWSCWPSSARSALLTSSPRPSTWPTATRSKRRPPMPWKRRRPRSRSGHARRTSSSPMPGRIARRRTPARFSSRPISRPCCANSSTRSARRSKPARAARTRSTRPTTGSTAATSRRSSCAAHASSAGCTPSRISTSGRYVEEPVMTDYKGVQVYKLNAWTQGPALLQSLNILENVDVKAMGYNSASTSTPSTRR